jgi:aspartyl-tRNA(Asn)/glutamyl-tRNA(Gln) amidotransferase subunit A
MLHCAATAWLWSATLLQDDLDATVARAYQRTLALLRARGSRSRRSTVPELGELRGLNGHRRFFGRREFCLAPPVAGERHGDAYDPRVALRIQRGATMSAADYVDLVRERALTGSAAWKPGWQGSMRCCRPTVPIVAPTIASVAPGSERDELFFRVNGLLLRNTSMVNMLDGCAISIPCPAPDELPVGLMVWHGAIAR